MSRKTAYTMFALKYMELLFRFSLLVCIHIPWKQKKKQNQNNVALLLNYLFGWSMFMSAFVSNTDFSYFIYMWNNGIFLSDFCFFLQKQKWKTEKNILRGRYMYCQNVIFMTSIDLASLIYFSFLLSNDDFFFFLFCFFVEFS